MGRKRQQTRSVRIDADIDEQLRLLAGERALSVNTLVAQALARLVEWDAYGEKFGFVDMPAVIVSRMLAFLDEAEVRELGAWVGSSLLREYVLFWFKEVTPESVLDSYPRLASKYGRLFEYEDHVKGGRRTLLIKHDGGQQLSAFYEAALSSVFADLLHAPVEVEATENQVVARFAAFPPRHPPRRA